MAELPLTPGGATLNESQLRFVAEYVADPRSKADAYRRAYNSPTMGVKSACASAIHLLDDARIQSEIAAARRDWCRKHRVTFQTVVRKLASIALGDSADLYEADPENGHLPKPRPWHHIPPAARKNIVTVKFKRRKLKDATDCVYELEELDYKVLDPMAALALLCQYLGVTKGSLTAEQLRDIIHGTSHDAQPLTKAVETDSSASGAAASAGSSKPGSDIEDGADAPAIRKGRIPPDG